MKFRTTLIFAVLLVALGAFYYVYEIRSAPEREKASAQKGRVFTVEAADVIDLTLKRGDEVVQLKREAEGWQMLEPVKARGDRGRVDETLTAVLTARVDREIDAAPKQLGEFGLEKPAAEVTLRLIGKKANQHFTRRNANIASYDPAECPQCAAGEPLRKPGTAPAKAGVT